MAQLVKSPPAMWETRVRSLVGKIPWRRERLPIPVFWPGKFHGLCSPWDLKESDTTERLSLSPQGEACESNSHPLQLEKAQAQPKDPAQSKK